MTPSEGLLAANPSTCRIDCERPNYNVPATYGQRGDFAPGSEVTPHTPGSHVEIPAILVEGIEKIALLNARARQHLPHTLVQRVERPRNRIESYHCLMQHGGQS